MTKCIQGILIKDNKILLEFHQKTQAWNIPGGKVEPKESERSALHREMREELGIDVDLKSARYIFISRFNGEYPVGSGTYDDFKCVVYRIYGYKGSIRNNEPDKHKSLEWKSFDEIMSDDFPKAEVLKDTLKHLRELRK